MAERVDLKIIRVGIENEDAPCRISIKAEVSSLSQLRGQPGRRSCPADSKILWFNALVNRQADGRVCPPWHANASSSVLVKRW